MKQTKSIRRLEPERVGAGSAGRLEYVLDRFEEADRLSGDLTWQSEITEDVTVEEVLGALLEADALLAEQKQDRDLEAGGEFRPVEDYRRVTK